ncbi:hypothetical protein JY409_09320 [Stenotrophomonas maltophilia]|nr:hypothetical protein [Stenotrophomonas maltophilia]
MTVRPGFFSHRQNWILKMKTTVEERRKTMTEVKSGIAQIRRKARALGILRAEIDGESQRTAQVLEQAARAASYWISADGRVGEADLATLLGITAASLANKRREGTAPRAFNLSGGGHRVTYRLEDVALWIESHRDT